MPAICMTLVASRGNDGENTFVEPLGWTPLVPCGLGGDRRRYTHERGTIFNEHGTPVARMAITGSLIPTFRERGVALDSLVWVTGDGRFLVETCVRPRKKRRRLSAAPSPQRAES